MINRPPPTTWQYVRMDVEPILPLMIADLLILIAAIVRWRRHPGSSALAATGAALALVWMCAIPSFRFVDIDVFHLRGVFNIVRGQFLLAIGLFHGLIGVAVFVGRSSEPNKNQDA